MWDITKLMGPAKWTYYYLYVVLDKQPGEIGGLLRREGLYWSNLANWRKQRERGELAGLSTRTRGPRRQEKNPLAERVRELERDNTRLKQRAERAEGIVELQKSLGDFRDRTGKARRDRLMAMVSEHRGLYSVPSICAGLKIGRASFYRWQRRPTGCNRTDSSSGLIGERATRGTEAC